ncbi:hypothetical protein FHS72_001534 [Loktanella ponticola]|uniref:LpxI family protein n=1 Tax=Yoonia ponticola TaxID=1524255 RepID=A0A7W9BK51_9RHOB|nr:UDP-2,3-diacylglucosamine diphosphatase LpxI [Yoonia ponticola]MBB5721910.1 hypothetical protein [Yoonia ponticola]
MLALIAGTGDLPAVILSRVDGPVVTCALHGFSPSIDVEIPFRIEHLGSFLNVLRERGVTDICMVGAIRRPPIDPSEIDAATLPLVPRIQAAIAKGDDGALREVIAIFNDHGFAIKAAHDIAPDLLPAPGFPTKAQPSDWHLADAAEGERTIAEMGAGDIGQACIVRMGQVADREDVDGTDAMLARFHEDYIKPEPDTVLAALHQSIGSMLENITGSAADPVTADDGILFKAPKPTQDRRADLPTIGFQTAMGAAEAGLAGIVIEADGVLVLDLDSVVETLDAQGMFLWVRPKGAL